MRSGIAGAGRSIIGRAAWGFGDQALSSLTNFGLAVAIANQAGTVGFGAFSIAFAIYLVALSVSRAVATDPLVIRYSSTSSEAWRSGARAATGMAVAVGVAGGVIAVAAGLLIGGSVGVSLTALGVGLPALLLQDAWRYAFFAAGRGRAAFMNDLAWAVALVLAFAVVFVSGERSVGVLVAAWAVGALAGAMLGVLQARVVPDPRRVRGWWREHIDMAPRLALEAAILSGAQPVVLSVVGAIAGLATVGTLRAAQVLMNAIHIATYGIHLFGVSEAVRMLERSPRHMLRLCVAFAGGLMILALGWGIVVLALPDGIGQALLGGTWEAARSVLLPITILSVAAGGQGGALIGLRALAASRHSLSARIVSSVTLSAGALGGALLSGRPEAIAWGMALGLSVGSIFWWWQLLAAVDGAAAAPRAVEPGVIPEDVVDDVPAI